MPDIGERRWVSQEPACRNVRVRGNRRALLQVVNPTGAELRLFAAFFDKGGTPLPCHSGTLPADSLAEADVRKVDVKVPLGV